MAAADSRSERRADGKRIDWTETFREIKEGLQFVAHNTRWSAA